VSGYLWMMRSAAGILFGVAIAIFVGGLVANFLLADEMAGLSQGSENFRLIQKLSSFFQVLQAAAWPFFGSAALWRADRWFAARASFGAAE